MYKLLDKHPHVRTAKLDEAVTFHKKEINFFSNIDVYLKGIDWYEKIVYPRGDKGVYGKCQVSIRMLLLTTTPLLHRY